MSGWAFYSGAFVKVINQFFLRHSLRKLKKQMLSNEVN